MTTQPNEPEVNSRAKAIEALSAEASSGQSSQGQSSQGQSPKGQSSQDGTKKSSKKSPQLPPKVAQPQKAVQRKATQQPPPAPKKMAPKAVTPKVSPAQSSAIVPTNNPEPSRRWQMPKVLRNTVLSAVFGATALVAAGLGAIAVLTFPLPRQISGETVAPPLADLWRTGFRYQVSRPVNILVMGLDEARDVEGAEPGDLVGRTDTMLLVRVDPEESAVNVMSIPRDTRVEIPGYGYERINQANFEGGAELAAQTVMHNFNNVEVDRYVRISTVAFKEIVDLVGGIEVLVPKEMKYEDKTQGLVIDLDPGLQNLNGDEAEQFARFRKDSYGDIGRVQRQQVLLKALRKRIANPAVLPKLPQIIRVLQERIDTNLSLEELLALAGFGMDLENKNLNMVMLPGEFSDPEEYGASYWLADYSASGDLMRTYFDATSAELVADSNGINYYEAPSDWAVNGLKIAIQNATDDQYASYSMAEYLREQGFNNVYVGRDWSDVNRKTSVVAQRGDVGSAQAVKSTIDIGQVVSDSTGDIDSDITIRVGEDWLQLINPEWQRLPYDGPR